MLLFLEDREARSWLKGGSNLFVVNYANNMPGAGAIGEYTTSGATVNASLISGLNSPVFLAIVSTASPVPEPRSLTLLALGLLVGLGFCWRKRAAGW